MPTSAALLEQIRDEAIEEARPRPVPPAADTPGRVFFRVAIMGLLVEAAVLTVAVTLSISVFGLAFAVARGVALGMGR